MPSYIICGLRVSSELELPGAIPEPFQAEVADVSIRRGQVPAVVKGSIEDHASWERVGETFLVDIHHLARFRITAGREILFELKPGRMESEAAGFVLETAFGILMHQRGALVLHGASVAEEGRAIVICGASGAGKSTLAAALCRGGCAFVADDRCVVGLDATKRPIVLPDGRQLKLWKESIDRLDLAQLRGKAVREPIEKYYIDPSNFRAQPSSLSAIYVLRELRPPQTKVRIESLALPDALRMLDYETYRPGLRDKIGRKPEMLAHAAIVLGHAKIFLLMRPHGFQHLQEMIAELRAHWESLDG